MNPGILNLWTPLVNLVLWGFTGLFYGSGSKLFNLFFQIPWACFWISYTILLYDLTRGANQGLRIGMVHSLSTKRVILTLPCIRKMDGHFPISLNSWRAFYTPVAQLQLSSRASDSVKQALLTSSQLTSACQEPPFENHCDRSNIEVKLIRTLAN